MKSQNAFRLIQFFYFVAVVITSAGAKAQIPGYLLLSDGPYHVLLRNPYEPDGRGFRHQGGNLFAPNIYLLWDSSIQRAEEFGHDISVDNKKSGSAVRLIPHVWDSQNWYIRNDITGSPIEVFDVKPSWFEMISQSKARILWENRDGWDFDLNYEVLKVSQNEFELVQTISIKKSPIQNFSVIRASLYHGFINVFDKASQITLPSDQTIIPTIQYDSMKNVFTFNRGIEEIDKSKGNERRFLQIIAGEPSMEVSAPGHKGWGIAQDLDFHLWASGAFGGPVLGDLVSPTVPLSPQNSVVANYGFLWKVGLSEEVELPKSFTTITRISVKKANAN